MTDNKLDTAKPQKIKGFQGQTITLDSLPPANTKRWVIRRKAELVAAVRENLLSIEEACTKYSLSEEEFASWEDAIDKNGIAGLRVTRIQQYR